MENLKPKIEKVLVKTINEHYDFYKAYAENDKILVEWKDPDMNKNGPEEWFFVPDYDHEGEFCFPVTILRPHNVSSWRMVRKTNQPFQNFYQALPQNRNQDNQHHKDS